MNSIIDSHDIDQSHPRRRIRISINPVKGTYTTFFWHNGIRYWYEPQIVEAEMRFNRTRIHGYRSPSLLARAGVLEHVDFARKNHTGSGAPFQADERGLTA